jgi:hypothetical protein
MSGSLHFCPHCAHIMDPSRGQCRACELAGKTAPRAQPSPESDRSRLHSVSPDPYPSPAPWEGLSDLQPAWASLASGKNLAWAASGVLLFTVVIVCAGTLRPAPPPPPPPSRAVTAAPPRAAASVMPALDQAAPASGFTFAPDVSLPDAPPPGLTKEERGKWWIARNQELRRRQEKEGASQEAAPKDARERSLEAEMEELALQEEKREKLAGSRQKQALPETTSHPDPSTAPKVGFQEPGVIPAPHTGIQVARPKGASVTGYKDASHPENPAYPSYQAYKPDPSTDPYAAYSPAAGKAPNYGSSGGVYPDKPAGYYSPNKQYPAQKSGVYDKGAYPGYGSPGKATYGTPYGQAPAIYKKDRTAYPGAKAYGAPSSKGSYGAYGKGNYNPYLKGK